MTTMRERLAEALRTAGISQNELARRCGTSTATVSNWLRGNSADIGTGSMVKAASVLGVSILWLVLGEGPMRPSGNVLAIYDDDATPEGWSAVAEYNVRLGAGRQDPPTWDEAHESKPAFYRNDWLRSMGTSAEKCRRLKVRGDSMVPALYDGDVVLCDCREGQPILSGKIYSFIYGGSLMVKRLYRQLNGAIIVHSDNEAIPDETVPPGEQDGFILLGRVIERSGTGPC